MTEIAKIGTPQELREYLGNSPTLLGINEEIIQKRKKIIQNILGILEYVGEDLDDFTLEGLNDNDPCKFLSEIRQQLSSILGDVVFQGSEKNKGLYMNALCTDEHGEQDPKKEYLSQSLNKRLGQLGLAHSVYMDHENKVYISWESNFQKSMEEEGPSKGEVLFRSQTHQVIFNTLGEKRASGKYKIWSSLQLQGSLTGKTICIQIQTEVEKMQRYLLSIYSKYHIGQVGRGLYILLERKDMAEIERVVQYELSLKIGLLHHRIEKNKDLTLGKDYYAFQNIELQGDEFYFLCLIVLSEDTSIGIISRKHPISKVERGLLIIDINEKIQKTGFFVQKKGKKYILSRIEQAKMKIGRGKITIPIPPWETKKAP